VRNIFKMSAFSHCVARAGRYPRSAPKQCPGLLLLVIRANLIYGAFRIIIAAISAVIVVFLIGADLLLGPLKTSDNFDGFVIACVVAGFSERFVPNVLKGLDAGGKAKR
jgi:hypothetical protein